MNVNTLGGGQETVKNKLTAVTSADIDHLIEEYLKEASPLHKDDKQRLDFVAGFAKWLLNRVSAVISSFSTEDQMVVFCCTMRNKQPRISVRFEAGTDPICYWFTNGSRKNVYFNDLQIKDPADWYERTFARYEMTNAT